MRTNTPQTRNNVVDLAQKRIERIEWDYSVAGERIDRSAMSHERRRQQRAETLRRRQVRALKSTGFYAA